MISEELAQLQERFAAHDGDCVICLATTANINNPPLLIGSPRFAEGILAGNLIFRETSSLPEIVKWFDPLVSRFFIDSEVKAGLDLGAATLPLIPSSRRHFFKPNDFTVDAADEWVAQRTPKLKDARIAIVGAGNIGAKLALRLAERGGEVRLVGRRMAVLAATVKGLSLILRGSGTVIACSSIVEACAQAEIIIGCTPGTSVIDAGAIKTSAALLLLDVGNGCFTRDAITEAQKRGIVLEVLSPTAGWEGFLRRYVVTRKLQQGLGRRQLESGDWVVSRGVMGATGDVLVDDIWQPSRVIGVCNGVGDLSYGEEVLQRIRNMEIRLGII
jgi:hypothetical protein